MSGGLDVGSRVMRVEWSTYPDWQHLARLGRVTHAVRPGVVEVRWDAGEFGAPAKRRLENVDGLAHLWWRST